ncbi:AMP-binding protein, partial [Amycolatopsis rhizosphaerae]
MPDCVTLELVVDHPRSAVWEALTDLELYPRFFRGVGVCERKDDGGTGQWYRLRANVCGPPAEHTLRVLLNRRGEQFVLDSEPNTAGCVSVQLTDAENGGTALRCIFFRPDGGFRRSAAEIRQWARDGLERLGRHLAGEPEPLPSPRPPTTLQIANTLVTAGVITPGRPDRLIRQLAALNRWGATLAGGYTAAAARSPHETAVTDDEGTQWSFQELSRLADRLGGLLGKLGAGEGAPVALLARNHAWFVLTLLACGKIGADVVLLNTGLAEPQVIDAVLRHEVRVLIADDEFAGVLRALPADAVVVSTGELGKLVEDAPQVRLGPPSRPGRLVVLTSGTTGAPKGARRPTPKGLSTAVSLLSRIPLRAGERMLVAAPLFHAWGLSALQVGMPLRANLVLQRRFDAEACLRAVAEHRCTSLFVVPVMLQRILNLPEEVRARYDTSSLRVVASSGAALPGALVTAFQDAFGDVLYNFYGSTEV